MVVSKVVVSIGKVHKMSDEYLVNNSWNLETMIKKALGETEGVLQNKLLISELE